MIWDKFHHNTATYTQHAIPTRISQLKNAEKVLRGNEDKFVIQTLDIRIPNNFKRFLSNDENKERMVELMEKVWLESSNEFSGCSLYVARASS